MTYDARQAALKEQDYWVEQCLATLCHAYLSGPNTRFYVARGVRVDELCRHTWCHGVVDVLNRAYGNEHVTYRIPEVGDAAREPLAGERSRG